MPKCHGFCPTYVVSSKENSELANRRAEPALNAGTTMPPLVSPFAALARVSLVTATAMPFPDASTDLTLVVSPFARFFLMAVPRFPIMDRRWAIRVFAAAFTAGDGVGAGVGGSSMLGVGVGAGAGVGITGTKASTPATKAVAASWSRPDPCETDFARAASSTFFVLTTSSSDMTPFEVPPSMTLAIAIPSWARLSLLVSVIVTAEDRALINSSVVFSSGAELPPRLATVDIELSKLVVDPEETAEASMSCASALLMAAPCDTIGPRTEASA